MKKYYSLEIPYITREDIKRAVAFKEWLTDNGISFEISIANNWLHFEILLAPDEVKKANTALDKLVYFDAITPI